MKLDIFSHTQKSFSEAVFSRFGKGKEHTARIYSQWFSANPQARSWAIEPQALSLVQNILLETDFSIPLCTQKTEGDVVKFYLHFSDGLVSESVVIPMESGITLCVSSQVGCKM